MYDKVNDVITGYIKTSEVIVQRKSEKTNSPRQVSLITPGRKDEVAELFYQRIIGDVIKIVIDKLKIECIRVSDKANHCY